MLLLLLLLCRVHTRCLPPFQQCGSPSLPADRAQPSYMMKGIQARLCEGITADCSLPMFLGSGTHVTLNGA
jgi:hypothetical protein